jgi:ribosomal protein L16/L10AE
MGNGKGTISHWCAKVSSGTIVFEVAGINDQYLVSTALKTGAAKLSVNTKIIF